MDGTGGKINSVTGIPVNDVFLQQDSNAQVTDINLCSLGENDYFILEFRGQDIK